MKYEIFSTIKVLEDNNYKVEIHVNPPPQNFLGIGFDLLFKEKIGELRFTHSELGSAFTNLSEAQKPLALTKNFSNEGKLVFGLTLKANDLPEIKNSHLVSLYFKNRAETKGNSILFEFQNQVISIFSGERINLENVHWQTMKFDSLSKETTSYGLTEPKTVPSNKSSTSINNKNMTSMLDEEYQETNSREEDTQSYLEKDTPQPANESSFNLTSQYLVFFGLLVLLLLICLLIRKFIKKKG